MRIVVWNCAQAFHTKYEALIALSPDIAVVPECAHPDVMRVKAPEFQATTWAWEGWNRHKGLATFTFGQWKLSRSPEWTDAFSIFLPLEVTGPVQFRLLALWAFNHRAPSQPGHRSPTTYDAISHYATFLRKETAVVVGDFNANVSWDSTGKYPAFGRVNTLLESIGLSSAYHTTRQERLGEESLPTLFWQRNKAKTYHVDYCYVPHNLDRVSVTVDVRSPDEWLGLSDHAPMVITIDGC